MQYCDKSDSLLKQTNQPHNNTKHQTNKNLYQNHKQTKKK